MSLTGRQPLRLRRTLIVFAVYCCLLGGMVGGMLWQVRALRHDEAARKNEVAAIEAASYQLYRRAVPRVERPYTRAKVEAAIPEAKAVDEKQSVDGGVTYDAVVYRDVAGAGVVVAYADGLFRASFPANTKVRATVEPPFYRQAGKVRSQLQDAVPWLWGAVLISVAFISERTRRIRQCLGAMALALTYAAVLWVSHLNRPPGRTDYELIWGMVTVALSALLFVPFLIFRPPRDRGVCHKCGYDLRATPDRCPECGTVPGEQVTPQQAGQR